MMIQSVPDPQEAVSVVDEAQLQIVELRRWAELGRLSASLLHEMSNPLTAAILSLDQYENNQSLNIRQARRNIQILQRYIEAARQQVRGASLEQSFSVRSQIEQVKRVLLPLARSRHVKLLFDPMGSYRLYGDPVKFQQIIGNLISNAVHAYDDLAVSHHERIVRITIIGNQQWLVIQVADRGPGITIDQLPFVFQPFYTTKSASGQGLGLGLTIIKHYVEDDFRGTIRVKSSRRYGTRFSVKLPVSDDAKP